MAQSVEKTAPTIEEAIQLALEELGVSEESVSVDILEEEGGPRPARVLVSTLEARSAYYGDDVEEEHSEDDEALHATRRFLQDVLDQFDLSAHIQARWEDGVLVLDIESEDCGIIIGRGGETLQALQSVCTWVANRHRSERFHLHLDACGYRRRHEEHLAHIARRTAAKVARSGRTFEMDPMNPADRRIVHYALQDFEGVMTYSEGQGAGRRVIICPSPKDEASSQADDT